MKKDLFKVLNRTKWKTYKFGEIAKSINERVNPNKTDLEIYVGLEHLDSDTIHIKRFGKKDDVKGEKLRCYPGDIIFGRRRAYQRKASIVNFDGFCSAHSLVLRANQNIIDPQLFPFFLHSDLFMHRAVDISVGSLSPTINWGTLKEQEFLLPPKEEQAKLAQLLWAADNVVEKDKALLEKLKNIYTVQLNQAMTNNNKEANIVELKDCLSENPCYGANASSAQFSENSPRYIRITDIDDNGNLLDSEKVTIDSDDYEQYTLKEGDFLFARTGNTVGKTFLYSDTYGHSVFAGYLIRFRLNKEKLLPKFLFYFTKSLSYESFKRKMIKVGAQPNINSEEYQSMRLPLPSIKTQEKVIDAIDGISKRIFLSQSKLQSSQALLKSLINEVFQ